MPPPRPAATAFHVLDSRAASIDITMLGQEQLVFLEPSPLPLPQGSFVALAVGAVARCASPVRAAVQRDRADGAALARTLDMGPILARVPVPPPPLDSSGADAEDGGGGSPDGAAAAAAGGGCVPRQAEPARDGPATAAE